MTDSQLQALHEQADALGVSYHHRAGAAKIQAAIDAFLVADNKVETPESVPGQQHVHTRIIVPLTPEQYRKKQFGQKRKHVAALIRCRIVCMNPEKKDWPGEIISVGSAKLGTFKKFIPFNTNEAYHIPQIIYDVLRERKCSVFYDETDRRTGVKTRKSRQINEFAVEKLPPLTRGEIEELKVAKAREDGRQGDY